MKIERTYSPDGPVSGDRAMHDAAHRAAEAFRASFPTIRQTLADAIKRAGGPDIVVHDMGFSPGKTKESRTEYNSILRVVQRHATEAGEQRGKRNDPLKAIKGRRDYAPLYEKALGKETVARVRSGVKGMAPLPKRGSIQIAVKGRIRVSPERKGGGDVRDRTARLVNSIPPHRFHEVFEAPAFNPNTGEADSGALRAWADYAGYGPECLRLDSITFTYES